VIGWPPAHNFIADFKHPEQKEVWLQHLRQLIKAEKKKLDQDDPHLNIKICFNKDNLGGSEPTRYSQCFTKTVQVRPYETALEIVNRCKYLFNLDSTPPSDNNTNSVYQLWLKTGKSEPLIPLIGK
jgi:hypothetical protein